MNDNNKSRGINILRDSVARRIAAGEVIDRPGAVVRELLDNSIDAGSAEISLYIKKGGTEEIRVVDNGYGMDAEDLQKCFLPHATSKIVDFEDIYSTATLGFRGEALSSVASCSKLQIISATAESPAMKLEVSDGRLKDLSGYRGSRGTIVSVKDIFYSMPGRKNFLKSPSAETSHCKTMFLEKALPQPGISFRFFSDDNLKLFLPASDQKSRVLAAYPGLFRDELLGFFSSVSGSIKISAATGTPSLYRKDRKYIQIFINKRRVTDFSLVQAVDYAYSRYLPGGCHPVCFLFLDIPPEHVDFNIHPAKREVKFRDLPAIHHIVSSAVGGFLQGNNSFRAELEASPLDTSPKTAYSQKDFDLPAAAGSPRSGYVPSFPRDESIFRRESLDQIEKSLHRAPPPAKPDKEADEAHPDTQPHPLVYLGQLFNLFLLYEYGSELLIIDQHAAHERLIFNSLSDGSPEVQDLLIPIRFSLEKNEESAFRLHLDDYRKLGFHLEEAGDGEWTINALPSVCSDMENDIIGIFKESYSGPDELEKRLFAIISCRSAIKDGDIINDITALELAAGVLELDNPRCPHGRPVIRKISREELFRKFGRVF